MSAGVDAHIGGVDLRGDGGQVGVVDADPVFALAATSNFPGPAADTTRQTGPRATQFASNVDGLRLRGGGTAASEYAVLREALAAVLLAAGQVQRVGVDLNQAVAALNSGELVEQLRWYAQAAARAIEWLDGLAHELRHRLLRMFRCPDSAMSMGSDQPSSARCGHVVQSRPGRVRPPFDRQASGGLPVVRPPASSLALAGRPCADRGAVLVDGLAAGPRRRRFGRCAARG
jgi:hypothetical protein